MYLVRLVWKYILYKVPTWIVKLTFAEISLRKLSIFLPNYGLNSNAEWFSLVLVDSSLGERKLWVQKGQFADFVAYCTPFVFYQFLRKVWLILPSPPESNPMCGLSWDSILKRYSSTFIEIDGKVHHNVMQVSRRQIRFVFKLSSQSRVIVNGFISQTIDSSISTLWEDFSDENKKLIHLLVINLKNYAF